MPVLELESVSKTFHCRGDTVSALRGVSLDVERGEFVAVQGASGSGKTTLLLASGVLQAPDEGRVHVDGQDAYALDPQGRARLRASRIGFVFQQFHLIPYLNVLDNVLAAALANPASGAQARAEAMLAELHLTERIEHRPAELSTGERQRVALARAMLNDPVLLLADEPTGNLDEHNARIVLDRFEAFAAQGGAVLMVTHSTANAACAQRTIHMEDGALVNGKEAV